MKKYMITAWAALLVAAASLHAGDPAGAFPKHKGSAELERLKTLAGTWEGKTDFGQGLMDISVQYRVLAGGSVVEERVFQGTPNEMVTMYYDKNGRLALTHYCSLGNRPGMLLKSADANSLKFDFDKSCGISETESHMRALTVEFSGADTITQTCSAVIDGKAQNGHPTTLRRVKAGN